MAMLAAAVKIIAPQFLFFCRFCQRCQCSRGVQSRASSAPFGWASHASTKDTEFRSFAPSHVCCGLFPSASAAYLAAGHNGFGNRLSRRMQYSALLGHIYLLFNKYSLSSQNLLQSKMLNLKPCALCPE